MIYVTSDAHGTSLARFLRLLDRAGFGDADRLFVLGGVIDRNDGADARPDAVDAKRRGGDD